MDEEKQKLVEELTKHFADRGKVIESGWIAMALLTKVNPSSVQYKEMRKVFFFGAQHLFCSILMTMDPGMEPTAQDLSRMDLIDKELKAFVEEMKSEKWT